MKKRNDRVVNMRTVFWVAVLVCAWSFLGFASDEPLSGLPVLHDVEAGRVEATPSADGNTLTVRADDGAVANFSSLSLGSGKTFEVFLYADSSFNVLSSLASALFRDISGFATVIQGNVSANGNLTLVNTSGIHFTPEAVVTAGTLIASALDISAQNFRNGNLVFERATGAAFSEVLNEGRITADQAALIGSAVKNTGVIVARAGTVHLAAGDKTTVSFGARGMLAVVVDESVTGQVIDLKDGTTVKDAVANHGTVEGHQVVMSAETANDVFEKAVNQTGVVKATRLEMVDGVIKLRANHLIQASGTLDNAGGSTQVISEEDVSVEHALFLKGDTSIEAGRDIDVKAGIVQESGDLALMADSDSDGEGRFTQALDAVIEVKDDGDLLVDGSGTATLGTLKTESGAIKVGTRRKPSAIDGQPAYVHTQGDLTVVEKEEAGDVMTLKTDRGDVLLYSKTGEVSLEATAGAVRDLTPTEIAAQFLALTGHSFEVRSAAFETFIYRNTGDLYFTSSERSGDRVTVAGEDFGTVSYRADSQTTFKTDGSMDTAPGVVLSGDRLTVMARQFGSASVPLTIDAKITKVRRLEGTIDILESLGIGTSVLIHGPPEGGFGYIVYGKDSQIVLEASRITVGGSGPVSLFGDITFSNFYCNIPGQEIYFEAGKTYRFHGFTYIKGQPGYDGLIYLFSGNQGTPWYSYFYGTQDISYVAIRDAHNLGTTIKVLPSTNWGNCVNWDTDPVWRGSTVNLYWSEAANWDTGTVPTATDTVTFDNVNNTNSYIDASFAGTIANLTINGYTGTITSQRSLTITGNYSQNSGTFVAPASTLTIRGNFTITGGLFNHNSGTVIFDGGANGVTNTVTSGGASFYDVEFRKTDYLFFGLRYFATIQLGDAMVVTNALTMTQGDFNAAGRTLTVQGTATVAGLDPTLINHYYAGTGKQTYNGGLTINANTQYHCGTGEVEVNNSDLTVTSGTFTCSSGILDINGNVLINGGTLQASTGLFTVEGNWTRTSGTFTHNNGTVTFDALTGTQTINSGGNNFYDINHAVAGTLQAGSALTVSRNLTNSAGIFDANGRTVTVTNRLEVSGGEYRASTATQTVNNTLAVSGGTFTSSTGLVDVNGTLAVSSGTFTCAGGTLDVSGAITLSGGTLTAAAGPIVVGGDLNMTGGTFTGSTGSLDLNGNVVLTSGTFTAPPVMTVAGNWTRTGATYNNSSGKVIFDGGANGVTNTVTSGGASFYDVEFRKTDYLFFESRFYATLVLGDALVVTNALTMTQGDFNAAGKTLTVQGTATVAGLAPTLINHYYAGTGKQTYNNGLTINANTEYHCGTGEVEVAGNFNISGGKFTSSTGEVDVNNITISSGTFIAPAATMYVSGNWLLTGGTYTHSSGIVNFDRAAGTQTLNTGGQGFYAVTHSGVGTLQVLDTNLSIPSNFVNSNGTFIAPAGTFSVAGNWTGTGGSYTHSSGTVILNGTTDQILATGSQAFYNLTLNNAGAAGSDDIVVSGALDVDNVFTLTNGDLDLDTNDPQVNIAGNITIGVNGSVTKGSGIVCFDGDLTYRDNAGGTNFGNIQIGASPDTTTLLSNLTADSLTIPAGDVLITSGYNLDIGTGGINISGGTLDATTAVGRNSTIAVEGNWNNTGTFTTSTSTVVFDGSGASIISGASTFNHLTCITPSKALTFAAGVTQTILGTLTLNGQANNTRIVLNSSDGATRFTLNCNTAQTVYYVDVSNSNASTSNISAYYSVDRANNDSAEAVPHWIFYYDFSGLVYSDQGSTLIGSGKTITLVKNGVSQGSQATDVNSRYTLTNIVMAPGDALLAYIDNNAVDGNTVTIFGGQSITDLNIYGSTVIARRDNTSAITNATFSTAKGALSDADIIYSVSSNNLTVSGSNHLLVWAGSTYTPGGNVTCTNLNLQSSSTLNGGSGTFDVNGNVSIASGATLVATSGTTYVAGNWSVTGGTFNHASGIVVFDKDSGTQTVNSGGSSFNTVNHPGAAILQVVTSALSAAGNLNNSGGDFDANGQSVSVTGTATVSGGTTYYAKSGTQTFGNLTITGATFTGANGTIDVNGNVTFTNSVLTATSGTMYVAGNWTNTNSMFDHNSGAVVFDGGSGSNIYTLANLGQSFNNVTVSKSYVWVGGEYWSTLRLTGSDLNVLGSFTVNQGIFDANDFDVTVSGLTTVTGTIAFPGVTGPSTYYYAKTGTQTFNGGLTVSGDGGYFAGSSGAIDITGNFTSSGGSTTLSSTSTTVSNNFNVSGGTVSGSSGAMEVDGDVNISGGTFTSTSGTFSVFGNWTRTAGAFNYGTSTVTFTGIGTSVIAGDTTFYGLSCVTGGKTLTFTAGTEQTVLGALTLTGTSADPVIVNDTGAGAVPKLTLNTGAFQDITNVQVTRNDASAGTELVAEGTSTLAETVHWALPLSPVSSAPQWSSYAAVPGFVFSGNQVQNLTGTNDFLTFAIQLCFPHPRSPACLLFSKRLPLENSRV